MNAQNDIPSCLDYFKRTFAIGAQCVIASDTSSHLKSIKNLISRFIDQQKERPRLMLTAFFQAYIYPISTYSISKSLNYQLINPWLNPVGPFLLICINKLLHGSTVLGATFIKTYNVKAAILN